MMSLFGVPSKFHNYRTQGRSLTNNEHGWGSIVSSKTGLNKDAKNGPDIGTGFDTLFTSVNISDQYRNYLHKVDN